LYDAEQIRSMTMPGVPTLAVGGWVFDVLRHANAFSLRKVRLRATRFVQTSSRSAPRLFRKKYADAPITIAKNATTAASIPNAPMSTRAPGTAANWCDQIAAYPSELCAASLPAGVVVHGAEQHRIANPIAKAKSVTFRSVFIGTQSTPGLCFLGQSQPFAQVVCRVAYIRG
jgi:hypothetical protein